jgi:hypothetical protein
MRRKKKRRFRKPRPLFHLTTKFELMRLTFLFVMTALRVGCRVVWVVESVLANTSRFYRRITSYPSYFLRHYVIHPLRRHLPSFVTCYLPRFVAYESSSDPEDCLPERARFDTDSFRIGIDTLCSVTMSGIRECFQDLEEIDDPAMRAKGIAGGLEIKGSGTFCFKIEDDTGKIHTIKLPNSMYVPGLPLTLLCPQHWSQSVATNGEDVSGTYIKQEAYGCRLVWNEGNTTKFVPLDPRTNTPTFNTAPGSFNYEAFEAVYLAMDASVARTQTVITVEGLSRSRGDQSPHPAEFIADEDINLPDKKEMQQNDGVTELDETVHTSNTHHFNVDPTSKCPIHPKGHHLWGECSQNPTNQYTKRGILTFSPTPQRDESELQNDSMSASDGQAELFRWHCRLGHLPFPQLKQLAEIGEIPKKLAKVPPPRCAGCLFGKMTKVAWRNKSKSNNPVHQATYPGECVSIDQLESTQTGFFAQLKGKLTVKRYTAATVFVDHFSRLRFIYLMTSMTSDETVKAKQQFERFAASHGVKIRHYHADNGRFADNKFKQHCDASHQQLTFCGVNAHFQNGIAERAIRDITEGARTMLLHAKARWPQAVHLSLWPYALRYAVYLHNTVPILPDGTSRLEAFSGVKIGYRMKDNHAFGCPVFALQNDLASGKKIPKWSPRARIGLNLGPSPNHARNVNLVLNLTSWLCSPQYHCRYDDFFETVRQSQPDSSASSTSSNWKQLAGLVKYDGTPTSSERIGRSLPTDHVIPIGTNNNSTPSTPDEISFTQDHQDLSDDMSLPDQGLADDVQVSEGASEPASAGVSSRGRVRKMSRAMQDSVSQRDFYGTRDMHYMQAMQGISPEEAEFDMYTREHDFHLGLQDRMRDPIAFHAEMMGDIMYFHQAMRQPDSGEFVKAVVKEINGHIDNKRWKLIKRSEVPKDVDVIPSVWSMRRKRNLTTNEVTKYKSRLNLHGGKQVYGMNYFETYAPVVTWFAIRLFLVLGLLFSLALRQVDFVQAYPQAPIEQDMFMELPAGIETRHGSSRDHVLQLLATSMARSRLGVYGTDTWSTS